jgi:hypothetical protein
LASPRAGFTKCSGDIPDQKRPSKKCGLHLKNDVAADGLGPLNYEARRGMYLHPTYAVTPGREPLGVLDAWMWAREMRDADGVRHGQKESARRSKAPNESLRWPRK